MDTWFQSLQNSTYRSMSPVKLWVLWLFASSQRILMHAQASQAHVTIVLCKLTFSQESRCRITSNCWEFVWEIKYWGLRTLNIIILTYFSIKEDLPLMYSCEFIDLVGFFGCYCLTPVTLFITLRINWWIHTKKQTNMLKVSLLYLFYRKISKNIMIFRVRRSQYFIPHTNSQWLLVT